MFHGSKILFRKPAARSRPIDDPLEFALIDQQVAGPKIAVHDARAVH